MITLTYFDLFLAMAIPLIVGLIAGQFCVIDNRIKSKKITIVREITISYREGIKHKVSKGEAKKLILKAMNNDKLKQS